MTWSYKELEQKLQAYWVAVSVRENSLLRVFFCIFGTAIAIILLLITCILSKSHAGVGLVTTVVAFGFLAAYILITGRAFHKENGVFCPHCGASLVMLGDTLDDLEEDGHERPESLKCARCHSLVVKKDT